MEPERRHEIRAAASATAIVLARHNAGVELEIDSISIGGARLVGEITLAVGERVQILFEIAGRPVDVSGEVVRAEQVDMSTEHVAVRFVELSDDAKESIRRHVQFALR